MVRLRNCANPTKEVMVITAAVREASDWVDNRPKCWCQYSVIDPKCSPIGPTGRPRLDTYPQYCERCRKKTITKE